MMKRAFTVLTILLLLVFLAIFWFLNQYPDVDAPAGIELAVTASEVERGQYLANSVAACIHCHSGLDERFYAPRVIPGTEGQGGRHFGKRLGFPGDIYVPNITPHTLSGWSDGELIRAIATGVSRDGGVSFPVMPYINYGRMAEADLYAIGAYLRSLPAIAHPVPPSEVHFPISWIMRTIPRRPEPVLLPEPADSIAYGGYLAMLAGCNTCHTPAERGAAVDGMKYAGGFVFVTEGGLLRSSNITPDLTTGIGQWTREAFIDTFKTYLDTAATPRLAEEAGYRTVMPWSAFAGMRREDLGAIHAYLQSLTPIRNEVEKFTPNP